MAPLTRRGVLGKLSRSRCSLARRLDVGLQEAPAREADVREREHWICLDRAAEVIAPASGGGEDAVGPCDVSVAGNL
jgi:hypothetical protein